MFAEHRETEDVRRKRETGNFTIYVTIPKKTSEATPTKLRIPAAFRHQA
jgi:hypothetical protein